MIDSTNLSRKLAPTASYFIGDWGESTSSQDVSNLLDFDLNFRKGHADILQDAPTGAPKLAPSSSARSTVSNVSRLHENAFETRSESVQSFECVPSRSEATYVPLSGRAYSDIAPEDAHRSDSVLSARRVSCPSVVSTGMTITSLSKDPINLGSSHRRVLSVCLGEHVECPTDDRLRSADRRERLKQSLSRLSESIASASLSLSRSRVNVAPPAPIPARSALLETVDQKTSFRLPLPTQNDSPDISHQSSRVSSHANRRDSGCVVYDEDLVRQPTRPASPPKRPQNLSHHSDESSSFSQGDLLSPVSSIAQIENPVVELRPQQSNLRSSGGSTPIMSPLSAAQLMGTLRIHPPPTQPPPAPVPSPVFAGNGAATLGPPTPSGRQQFTPSQTGVQLMTVYNPTAPQQTMWDTFVAKAKAPVEYADTLMKMPSVVFTLRGLIRFGNGDVGALRTDVVSVLMQILLGRHPVADTSAAVEAAECSASILSLLAINPVSRRSGRLDELKARPKFEPAMMAQNGMLFQQLIACFTQAVPKWCAIEGPKDGRLPLSTRAACALLEVLFIYSNHAKLRSAWLDPAPAGFKQSLPMVIASIPQRLPLVVSKCVCILDELLEVIPLPEENAKRIGQMIREVVSSVAREAPDVAAEATTVLNRWSSGRGRTIGKMFKSWSRSKSVSSIKSTIYGEYSNVN